MARLFGTDGIRGVANVDLKPTMAYALGRAVAARLVGRGGAIVVGQDTRRSGDMFVAAIAAGATSLGVDVHHVVGVVPTPALAFLAGEGPFAAGIMVSASHNPADDNGLKVLDGNGLKLDDSIEDELEQLIWRTEELPGAPNDELGRMIDAPARLSDYRRTGSRSPPRSTRADCGSSSTAPTAPARSSGRRSSPRPAPRSTSSTPSPTASTSTSASGATAPGLARARRSSPPAPMSGFALDGDADRLIAVDAAGRGRRRRPGPRDPGPRPAEPRRAARWRARRLGPLERRAPGASSRRRAARSCGPRSATSTSSRGCRSRARSSAARRAATSSSSSTRRRATGS